MDTAFDMIAAGFVSNDACLTSEFEIENLLIKIQELSDKSDHLKGLNKFRKECADRELGAVNLQISQFRQVILNTMKTHKPDQKTLQFPSVGKVTRKLAKSSWRISDEELLITFLKSKGNKDVVKVRESLDAREAKKLIEDYAERGETVPGVEEIPAGESVSIAFEQAPKPKNAPVVKDKPVASAPKPTLDQLALNV